MVHIDYTSVPETYAIKPIAKWNDAVSDCNTYMKARTDAIIEKALENPGKYILIVSTISSGDSSKSVMLSLSNGTLWEGGSILESVDAVMGLEGKWEEEDT
jgi:hypothetical protein